MDKNEELNWVNQFRLCCSDFPTGELLAHEEPDFLIHSQDGILGIEVIEYNRPVLRQQEEELNHVVRLAQEIFEDIRSDPLLVQVRPGANAQFSKKYRSILAQSLAIFINDLLEGNETTREFSIDFKEFRKTPLKGYISHLDIYRQKKMESKKWVGSDGVWGLVLDEELVGMISAKEVKLPAYRKKCNRVWLLIFSGNKSNWVDLESPSLMRKYLSSFDRVIFFDRPTSKIIHLSP